MDLSIPRRLVVHTAGVLFSIGTAAANNATNETQVIEEVLVTAEKRTTSTQDTSIAITAFAGDELDLRGLDEIIDLQFAAPNLVISHNSQSPVTYAYIRGIGSDQLVAGFDPGVAYHVDGIYVGQPSAMPSDLWDMERVEVLRGVQGTLYGRNTTGGSINVITRDPDPEFSATGDVTLGNYDRRRFRGVVNVGNERVSARLAAISDEADGYQENIFGSDDGDVTDLWAVRGKLRFALADGGDLVLTGQRFQNDGPQVQKKREQFTAPVYAGALPNPEDPRKVGKNLTEELDLTNDMFSARLTWDFSSVRFVSITGYIENDWYQNTDNDASSNAIQFQNWEMETDQFTQEFQLISQGEGPWEWIIGAFYLDEDLDSAYMFDDVALFTFFNGGQIETESWAVFGQVGYDLSESGLPLKIVGGLRYTDDEKSIDEYQIIPDFGVNRAGSMSESWDEVTGKLELDWYAADDVMAYITYSHGYKGGGFSLGQFDAFDPETVDSFEIGVKSQMWDNRAQVNVAAFYNDYNDLQVNFLVFTSFTTDNAAEATIKGIEIEGTIIPVNNLLLSGAFTWLDAKFDEYQFTPAIDLAGDTLNRAPEYTVQLSGQYDWQLGNIGTLTARIDYYWRDDVYYRVQNIPRHEGEDFSTTDLRLMWTSADQRWVVDAFVKNAADNDALRSIAAGGGTSIGDMTSISYFPPRTYGLRVGIEF